MIDCPHIPVLLKPVLATLLDDDSGVYIDGTFGAGGYTRAILNVSPNNKVIGFDRDPNAVQSAKKVMEQYAGRFQFIHDLFGNMAQYVSEKVDGIVLDIGVSSMQIDKPERGFSFRFDGPLDMRMAQAGLSAKDVVNTFKEKEIADILFKYGEEKASRRIAAAIVRARAEHEIATTAQLADIVHKVMPRPRDGSDSAMRTFQALRIFVNDELGELERALAASIQLLKPGGRLVVVTFHSLEDRIVKNFIIQHAGLMPNENRHMPQSMPKPALFSVVTKKPILPAKEELSLNPRSHSAKLRAAKRTEVLA
ncbi:MAG: 16S rRNA (cytosine(1402)-N(4))-methyltransferase RsmH [Alphaproteobacteria bacterium]|nr:16S rRNA (cytosine(1402)-N(4))-methyltransferase RsmH [Alphaproteobacteria bacterium]